MALTQAQLDEVIDNGGGVSYGGAVFTDKQSLRDAMNPKEAGPTPSVVPAANLDNSKVVAEGDEVVEAGKQEGLKPAEQVAGKGSLSSEEVKQPVVLTDAEGLALQAEAEKAKKGK